MWTPCTKVACSVTAVRCLLQPCRAGASHINIAAHGGQYGVWFAESEPGPVLAGGVFSNQTVSAVAFVAGHHAQGPLIVVGVNATQGPAPASGPLFSNVG